VLGLPNEIAVGIAGANHKSMTKFSSAQSQKYRPVWVAIERLCLAALMVQDPGTSRRCRLMSSSLIPNRFKICGADSKHPGANQSNQHSSS
jgi:hypothetical protein